MVRAARLSIWPRRRRRRRWWKEKRSEENVNNGKNCPALRADIGPITTVFTDAQSRSGNELINSTDYYSDDETNTNDIKKDKLIMEFKDNDISEESIENSHTHICESNGEQNHDTTNWDDETAPPSISMVPFIKY